jgi:uncharacterized protein YjiS (DUF1127 family)
MAQRQCYLPSVSQREGLAGPTRDRRGHRGIWEVDDGSVHRLPSGTRWSASSTGDRDDQATPSTRYRRTIPLVSAVARYHAGRSRRAKLAKLQTFVADAKTAATAHVLDGQLFHGDLTNLFLMDAGSAAIVEYLQAVEEIVQPLTPLLVYFYQDDISQAIRAIATERGEEWVKYRRARLARVGGPPLS